MATLKDLARAVQQDLPITVRMERWMLANSDPVYSEAAIQFSDDFLRKKVGGNRANRRPHFRASGLGKCARARVFARIGAPKVDEQFSSAQANIFATGNFMHRKWQMAGLTEGWLTDVEVPLENEDEDLGGTADGYIYDGSLFEYKTANDRSYGYVNHLKEPLPEHKLQVGGYKLLNPSLTKASVLYENKNTGEWREYRVDFDDELMTAVRADLDVVRNAVATRKLPKPLPACIKREGMAYRRCPFREYCIDMYDADLTWLDVTHEETR